MAIIEHEEGGSYGGYFPSLPGAIAAADTRDELVQLLRGALVMQLHAMQEDGEAISASDEDEEAFVVTETEVAAGLLRLIAGDKNATSPAIVLDYGL